MNTRMNIWKYDTWIYMIKVPCGIVGVIYHMDMM